MAKQKRHRRDKKQQERKKFDSRAVALLSDSTFLFQVVQQVGTEGVIGEHRSRLILYLACLTGCFERVVSVMVKGPTSTGKNNLVKAVLTLIPPELVLWRSSMSQKALAYGKEDLAGKILYMVEHRSGRDAQFFTRLLQSEGALEHESTVAVGSERGTQIAARIGSPVILTTTTDEQVYEDDETRFLSLRADESSELTEEVVNFQFTEKQEKNP